MDESKVINAALLLIDVASAYLLIKKIQVRFRALREQG